MRKIPEKLENPVDNFIYYFVEKIAPIFYKLGFTPNMVTTLGNICTIISIYFFIKQQYYYSALFFFFSYFFDCLDGYIARSYNMTSQFGDFYDHISDMLKMLSFLILFITINHKLALICIPIILIGFILCFIHLANQEIYYGKPESSKTLQVMSPLTNAKTKQDAYNNMMYSRYFGCGTNILLITIMIAIYKKRR